MRQVTRYRWSYTRNDNRVNLVFIHLSDTIWILLPGNIYMRFWSNFCKLYQPYSNTFVYNSIYMSSFSDKWLFHLVIIIRSRYTVLITHYVYITSPQLSVWQLIQSVIQYLHVVFYFQWSYQIEYSTIYPYLVWYV